MSEKKITITGDDMLETRLKKNSKRLNISICELIDHYIRRALYHEYLYEPKPLTREELTELSKKKTL